MGKLYSLLIAVLVTAGVGWAQTENPVSITSDGWTVAADGQQGVLGIAYENLGMVLKDVRLNLRGERGLSPLKNWSVQKEGQSRLSIRTAKPPSGWLVELGPNTLKISSTLVDAVLTGEAPTSTDRVVARFLDPQGVPVTWVGTDEFAAFYGGSETRNQSFLPSRNPEVMYFALGQVASSNLHNLFDRRSDTAVNFSDQTVMQRNSQDVDLLDLTIPVPGSTLVRLVPDYYTKTLGVPFYAPFDDSYFSKAPAVWCSWIAYYDKVREEDIVRNTDWIAANLKPYGLEYVQTDDGYDRGKEGEHYWIEKWDRAKFPHGPQWLANYIRSKGLRPGLWLVPNAYAGAMEQHPDWYLRDKEGKIIHDYSTPALDSTNPEVLGFLKKLFTTLDDWGFEYYKFDGECAYPRYVPAVDKNRLHDKSIDPIVAYRNRLKLIRETIGPKRFVEGCPGGTPLNGIGYMNSYFNWFDVFNRWQGMYNLFSSINANAFLNHIVAYVMPGEAIELLPPMTVAEAEIGTTMAEARTLVSYISLTGVVYPLSDILPELPEEKIKLLKMTLPTMPILPIDLFSRGHGNDYPVHTLVKHTTPDYYIHNYPEILDLKVNAKSGVYDVVGLTNWRSWTTTRELSFADKLGVDPGASYVVFDFWSQKLLGVFNGKIAVTIEPHDTRVLLIHPVLNRPQLIGTSRHITGAYSILNLAWDGAGNRLRGSSETVAGAPFTLWVYVPKGMNVSQVRAATRGNPEVPVQHELNGNSLTISFAGQPEAVNWEAEFTGHATP